jgi:hypothetical protein
VIINSHAIFSIAKEIDIYRQMFESFNKIFNGINLLPLAPQIYNDPAEFKNLMWPAPIWEDNKRNSDMNKSLIKLLADNIPIKVYGKHPQYSLANQVYDGMISPGLDNINTIRQNGIYLLTHSDRHFASETTSMKGFEATSAGAIVISDKNSFIMKHFGDSFLYFDQEASPQEIYSQIASHIDWIRQNPEKARAKVKQAMKIAREKFNLKNDLIRIAKVHEGVLSQEQAMNLSHPLAY